jgi:hypothetical protein
MSLKKQAKQLAKHGRYGDDRVIHVSQAEIDGLASLIPGGKIPTNPKTGMPEAFFFLPFLTALGGLGAAAAPALAAATVPTAAATTAAGLGAAGAAGLTAAEIAAGAGAFAPAAAAAATPAVTAAATPALASGLTAGMTAAEAAAGAGALGTGMTAAEAAAGAGAGGLGTLVANTPPATIGAGLGATPAATAAKAVPAAMTGSEYVSYVPLAQLNAANAGLNPATALQTANAGRISPHLMPEVAMQTTPAPQAPVTPGSGTSTAWMGNEPVASTTTGGGTGGSGSAWEGLREVTQGAATIPGDTTAQVGGGFGGGFGMDKMLQYALPLMLLTGGDEDLGLGGDEDDGPMTKKEEKKWDKSHAYDGPSANFKGFDTTDYGTVGGGNTDEFRFFSKGGLVKDDKMSKKVMKNGGLMAMMANPHLNIPKGMDPSTWMAMTMPNVPPSMTQPYINMEMSRRGAEAQETIGGLEDQLSKLKKKKVIDPGVPTQGVPTQGVPGNAYLDPRRMGFNKGGLASLPQGEIDTVPAMLQEDEFVMNANAVKGLGGGSTEKGAEKLYAMQDMAENMAPNPEVPDRELVAAAAEAIMNPGPRAHEIIMAFVEQFGEEALEDLIMRIKQTGGIPA